MYGRANWLEKYARLHLSANFMAMAMTKVTTKTHEVFKANGRQGMLEEEDRLIIEVA